MAVNERGVAHIARATYDAAHEHFDAAPLRFWSRYGARTVERMGLAPGARVLDLCAGTGGSALPAARAVGASGSVVALDISSRLLELAQHKAQRAELFNVETVVADMTKIEYPEASFDAVAIVFGLFFAQDMQAQVRSIYRVLKPGGVMAVTIWGPRLFEPLYSPYVATARALRPRRDDYRPWDRITNEASLAAVAYAAPFASVDVAGETGVEKLDAPEDWWTIVLGTGFRWFVDGLDAPTYEAIRDENVARASRVKTLETNVVYAIARK